MRTKLLVAFLGAVAIALTIALVLPGRGSTHASNATGPMYLFSQEAAGGTLTGADEAHLTLTLTGVRDFVTRFTDRPARHEQVVDIRDFLELWPVRFKSDPPNAVLAYNVAGDARPRTIAIELRNPRFNRAKGTLVYAAQRLNPPGDKLGGIDYARAQVRQPIPHRFGAAALFIDDARKTCCVAEE